MQIAVLLLELQFVVFNKRRIGLFRGRSEGYS